VVTPPPPLLHDEPHHLAIPSSSMQPELLLTMSMCAGAHQNPPLATVALATIELALTSDSPTIHQCQLNLVTTRLLILARSVRRDPRPPFVKSC
jgi:hypothetical protein